MPNGGPLGVSAIKKYPASTPPGAPGGRFAPPSRPRFWRQRAQQRALVQPIKRRVVQLKNRPAHAIGVLAQHLARALSTAAALKSTASTLCHVRPDRAPRSRCRSPAPAPARPAGGQRQTPQTGWASARHPTESRPAGSGFPKICTRAVLRHGEWLLSIQIKRKCAVASRRAQSTGLQLLAAHFGQARQHRLVQGKTGI